MTPRSRKIDINSASLSTLTQVPRVGPALASEIIAARPYARLSDLKLVSGVGEKLYIILKGYLRVSADSVENESNTSDNASSSSSVMSGKLDVNKASIEELQGVPGIGLALAETIVAGRPYGRLPDLQNVAGIGHKLYAGLRKYLRVPIDSSLSDTKNPSPSKSSLETQYSSSTTQFDHIPTMPSFEESSGSLINVSDELDVTSKETDPVEVNTVQELIGPPIVDGSPMSAESETSETVSLDSVKIVNRELRSNWRPVNIAIRPYRRKRRWKLLAAMVIAGIILGLFQTYGLLGNLLGAVNLNPMQLLSFVIDQQVDEQVVVVNTQEDKLQVVGVSTIPGKTVVSSQVAQIQPTLTAVVVEPSPVIKATSESTQTVSEIASVISTATVVTIPTATPIPSATATQLPTPTKTIPIPESVRKIGPNVVPKSVLWKEEFEPLRFADWGTEDSKNFYSAIEDGVFRLITKSRGKRFYSSASPQLDMVGRDYYYEGDVIVDDCTGNDFYGLVFKASLDIDEFFAATITCVGNYRLIRRADGFTDFLRIAVSDVVPPGPGTYRLGILVKSDSFTLYVDGVEVYTQASKDLGKVVSGEFGIYAQSVESEELRVNWDNLVATEIER